MQVSYLSPLDLRFHVRGLSERRRRWQLIRPFLLQVDGEVGEIPPSFWTDFASIPRPAWLLIAPEELGYGPVPHDWGYYSGLKTKAYWDDVFMACMELDGIEEWRRAAAWQAVHLFGGATWDRYRRQGSTAQQLERLVARVDCGVAMA